MKAPSALLLALESRALLEWGSLVLSWPWLERKAPIGDGHPVMVLPGLAASDTSTWPLRKFLERRGYAVHPWQLGFNVGPRGDMVKRLSDRVRTIESEHGRKLSLIGWSLGGAMARAIAVAMPERVRSVITLGSPLGGHPKATNAWRIFELVSGYSADDPRLLKFMERHPDVPMTSILSKSDGIVNWRMSLLPPAKHAENILVQASHFGLGANPAVLWAIADRLAQREGTWTPFERKGWHSVFYREHDHTVVADQFAT